MLASGSASLVRSACRTRSQRVEGLIAYRRYNTGTPRGRYTPRHTSEHFPPPSRTRLVKDLSPRGPGQRGDLVVAADLSQAQQRTRAWDEREGGDGGREGRPRRYEQSSTSESRAWLGRDGGERGSSRRGDFNPRAQAYPGPRKPTGDVRGAVDRSSRSRGEEWRDGRSSRRGALSSSQPPRGARRRSSEDEGYDGVTRGGRDEWRGRLNTPRDSWDNVKNIYDEEHGGEADPKPASQERDSFGTTAFLQREFRTRMERREKDRASKQQDGEQADVEEFDHSSIPRIADLKGLPNKFSSPPLMEGLLESLRDVLGRATQPSPIQALSLQHIVSLASPGTETPYGKFLLASETGSGKSFAYMLPLLHHVKQAELARASNPAADADEPRSAFEERLPLNPRALILAPTHELSRQLSTFAKSLVHKIKLRIMCTSRANTKSTARRVQVTASKLAEEAGGMQELGSGVEGEELVIRERKMPPVDVLIGTPAKLLEMVHGRGWDREERERREDGRREKDEKDAVVEDNQTQTPESVPRLFGKPEMGLANVEWVVVDEADVLFDPDFQEYTMKLLADISEARGHPVPDLATSAREARSEPVELAYPFNLLLSTATIPSALAHHLDDHHPSMTRLASPDLHHLPAKLQTEYVAWTGGNQSADIEQEIRKVWRKDVQVQMRNAAATRRAGGPDADAAVEVDELSNVLVFCNRSTRVEMLGKYLTEKGIANVALTSTADVRKRGNSKYLEPFLRDNDAPPAFSPAVSPSTPSSPASGSKAEPSSALSIPPPPPTAPEPEDETLVVDAVEPPPIASPPTPTSASAATTSPPRPVHPTQPLFESAPSNVTLTVDIARTPHVLITTSLLSRGLDFAPSTHVFITDPPRNMVDFLHRAGRAGRAGKKGRVVIFSKMKGRGSDASREMRKSVGALRGG